MMRMTMRRKRIAATTPMITSGGIEGSNVGWGRGRGNVRWNLDVDWYGDANENKLVF